MGDQTKDSKWDAMSKARGSRPVGSIQDEQAPREWKSRAKGVGSQQRIQDKTE